MRKLILGVGMVALLLGAAFSSAGAGVIEPGLQSVLDSMKPDETISVLVYLQDRVDLAELNSVLDASRVTLKDRHEVVVTTLQDRASATQASVLTAVEGFRANGAISKVQPFWVANCFRLDATPAVIQAVAARPDVDTVYLNYGIELIRPVGEPEEKAAPEGEPRDGSPRTPTSGLVAVRAPEVWALGFTGEGVLVATLDTGVEGTHPALASRWRGVADPRYAGHPQWAWFDPVTNTTFPQSFGAHGTHTMGSVCGGPPGDEIGVAPGAQWIHAAVIDRVSIPQTVADALAAFQWLIDPDGNPATNWDVPAVCSNSWRVTTSHGYPPCDQTFWTALDACEAAGIVILFSAGNEGPSAQTIGRPPDRATDAFRTCSVGAIDANTAGWPIADFSSRGPSYCTPDGSAAIKPELVAPGVNVYSSVPGGGYEASGWSGTSMASPHVNGVVALIREACPDLSVQEVKEVLYETAVDLGPAGEDNAYGLGIVDAYEAVQLALSLCSGAPRARNSNLQTAVGSPLLVTLQASDYDGLPNPPGALTYIITSLPASGNTLTDPANNHVITAGDLPYSLLNFGNQVLYTPAPGYYGTDTFQFKANDGGTPPDGGDSNVAIVSILVLYDAPVITTTSLPPGLLNGLYGPVSLEASNGQPPLNWIVLTAGQYYETNLGSSQFSVVGTAQNWRADDNSWSYTLPFAFPFYGSDYTTIYVGSNGYLNMDGPASDYSNSDSAFLTKNRIAAMWDDLRTDGTGGDIFVYTGISGQVTFRWAATTYSGGNPCNFSITLFEDGRIQFHYGSGNTGLTPTIGLSAGNGTNYLFASYNNAASLTNANSLEFTRPATLPAGVTLSPDGVLSGIPTQAGTFQPTFRVTDSLNRSHQRMIDLVINTGPVPPIASNVATATPVSTPVLVTLTATDDGLPDPPAGLTYIVTSLPGHGTLSDPNGGPINAVPYTLANGGNQVLYTPQAGYRPSDSFEFKANDGGTPPGGGDSNTATVNITIGGAAFDPVAQNQNLTVAPSVPTNIVLSATDPNGDPLTFVIESLPASGTGLLVDPNAGQILSVPHTLVGGNVVRYLPPYGQIVGSSFTFTARDATATSNVATVTTSMQPGVPQVAYSWLLDTNPGWATEGLWAFGQPTGGGSHNRDPNSGYTGSNVYGYNLTGDYSNNMTVPRYLTTTPIDCRRLSGTTLRFRRWLGVEGSLHDFATIGVSTDGTNWTTIWQNPTAAVISENAWSLQTYDISSVADGAASLYIRWGMGPTDAGVTYPGWNIDDIELIAVVNFSCVGVTIGDVNGDGVVNGLDIQLFAAVALDPYAPGLTFTEFCAADVNADGFVTMDDVPAFVTLLLGL